jgi:hypothetical protein
MAGVVQFRSVSLSAPPGVANAALARGGTQELNDHVRADIGLFEHCTTSFLGLNGGRFDATRVDMALLGL